MPTTMAVHFCELNLFAECTDCSTKAPGCKG